MSIPNAPGDDAEPAAASAATDADFDFSRSPHDQFFKSRLRRPAVAAVATAAEPKEGGTIAMTLAEKLRAEGRVEGLTLAEKLRVEGRAEGRVEGLHKGLEALLDARFGDAGLALLPEVERITDIDRLQALLDAIRHAETLDGVRQTIRG